MRLCACMCLLAICVCTRICVRVCVCMRVCTICIHKCCIVSVRVPRSAGPRAPPPVRPSVLSSLPRHSEVHKKGQMTTGHSAETLEFLTKEPMPCRHMPCRHMPLPMYMPYALSHPKQTSLAPPSPAARQAPKIISTHHIMCVSLSLSLSLFIYIEREIDIYIYIEREIL